MPLILTHRNARPPPPRPGGPRAAAIAKGTRPERAPFKGLSPGGLIYGEGSSFHDFTWKGMGKPATGTPGFL